MADEKRLATHFGDPCIHCATPHDEVDVGPCRGDMSKAVPIAWCSLGVRWDGMERFRYRMSDGTVHERYGHIRGNRPWSEPPRYDASLAQVTHVQ